MELILIRHGQSVGNIRVHEDMPDSPLTELGMKQAEKVAKYVSKKPVTRIVSSPLVRAVQTAQPLSEALSLQIELWKDLYEYREGSAYIGPSKLEWECLYPEVVVCPSMEEDGWCYPGGETPATVCERAKAIIQKLREPQYENDCIAMFAHGSFNDYLIREILHISSGAQVSFHQSNTNVNIFVIKSDGTEVRKLNLTEHLELAFRT
ncbi:histidine phosphatase family protein [Paenibacillus oenotherae]|uniref:Histidine phosphatase family protein n=1 Tax=Paenibacillus oenotherae TaxID=1435645 RepID=A0ABS7D7A3_9BACL|nr:histidine phosphatase family protein [Paenibacillus oenotherae]MBW7475820.1 histidine phosphatase family protein [Paenibacillus oenotherae]